MAATRALAFTTTEGVVGRGHRDTARLRPHALPTVATGLADLHEVGFGVAHFADRGAAVDRHAPHFGARQAKGGEVAFLCDELHPRTGAAGHLPARSRLELDVVHHG